MPAACTGVHTAMANWQSPDVLPALQMLRDPEYLNSVLGSLPGVNPNDPALQSALQNLHGSHKGAEDKSKSEKKDDSK